MAMVAVVYWLLTGGLMAQANWFGPKVGRVVVGGVIIYLFNIKIVHWVRTKRNKKREKMQ